MRRHKAQPIRRSNPDDWTIKTLTLVCVYCGKPVQKRWWASPWWLTLGWRHVD